MVAVAYPFAGREVRCASGVDVRRRLASESNSAREATEQQIEMAESGIGSDVTKLGNWYRNKG